jgi:hypothetical protein
MCPLIPITVIPAQAGIQRARACAPKTIFSSARPARGWTPAFAGVTRVVGESAASGFIPPLDGEGVALEERGGWGECARNPPTPASQRRRRTSPQGGGMKTNPGLHD